MIKKSRHKLHISLFISTFLLIVVIIKFISYNDINQAFWISFRSIYPYIFPVAIVLLFGLVLQWRRRPWWDRIYLIAWIVFAITCTIILTTNILSSVQDDSEKGGLYSWIGSDNSIDDSKNESIMEVLNKRIVQNPNDDEAFLLRGYAKCNLQNYTGAIVDFSKVIELNPNGENAFSARGAAKLQLQDYKGAILDYNRAIEITGFKGVDLYKERAGLKYLIQDYEGAIADYHRIIELEGMKITDRNLVYTAFLNKADIEFELEDYDAAVFDYTFAIDFNPGSNISAYYKRGLAKLKLGLTDDACLDFRKAGDLGNSEAYDMILKYCQ